MKRVYFLGKSTQQAIQAECVKSLKKWIDAWCFTTGSISVDLCKKPEGALAAAICFASEQTPTNILWLNDDGLEWDEFIFGDHAKGVPADSIKETLIQEAKTAFIQNLYKTVFHTSETPHHVNECPPEATGHPGSGDTILSIQIYIGDFQLQCFCLIGAWVEKYTQPLAKPRQKLNPLSSTIGGNDVAVEVNLNLGDYNIGLIKNLALGDILISDISIETPFNVNLSEKTIAKAYLGKSDEHKAIYLQPVKSRQTK